jgi:hypothetical protein
MVSGPDFDRFRVIIMRLGAPGEPGRIPPSHSTRKQTPYREPDSRAFEMCPSCPYNDRWAKSGATPRVKLPWSGLSGPRPTDEELRRGFT